MGKGKNLNPADKQRKKDREREKKRNREDKTMMKEIVHLDPDAILAELKEIARKEGQGYIDHAQSKRKRTLMEMHKKATQKVKHEEKKAQKEAGGGLTAAMNAALAPAAASGSSGGSGSLGTARAPVAFDFGSAMRPPPPPTPTPFGAAPTVVHEDMPDGYTDYQQSIYRLKKLEQEEERERGFRELLEVQLRAQEQAKQQQEAAARAAPEVVPYAATIDLRPQKAVVLPSGGGGGAKRKKVVETDALGNVIAAPSAPKPAPKPVSAPIPAPAAKSSHALGMLGGYTKPQEDPYEAFLRDINKV